MRLKKPILLGRHRNMLASTDKLSSNKPSNSAPWYKEPWLWFVLAPIIVVMLVSSFTVSIAIYSADDVVSDNYYKEGRLLAQSSTADAYAQSLGLRALLTVDNATGEVVLDVNQTVDVSRLSLLISHPAEAARDQTLPLQPVGKNRYRADTLSTIEGRWYLRVTAFSDVVEEESTTSPIEKEVWRLHGEINLSDSYTATLE